MEGLKKSQKSDVMNELNKRRESKKLNVVGGFKLPAFALPKKQV